MCSFNIHFKIQLYGPFELTFESGENATPRSSKSCALLAMLALSDKHILARRWIESKLWSDRGQAQASASLRQAIAGIKKSTKNSGLILADRKNVWLDTRCFTLASCPETPEVELLQGLDIRDSEFDDWLSVQRSFDERQRSNNVALNRHIKTDTTPTAILISNRSTQPLSDCSAQRLLQHQISKNLQEQGLNSFLLGENSQLVTSNKNQLQLNIEILSIGLQTTVHMELQDPITQQLHWTNIATINNVRELTHPSNANESSGCLALAMLATDKTVQIASSKSTSGSSPQLADALTAKALKHINTFQHSSLETADKLLEQAQKLRAHPKQLALRSFLRMVMFSEQSTRSRLELIDESDKFAAEALQEGADNSMVLSLLSQVQAQLNRDIFAAQSLAESALYINPGNALALDSSALYASIKGNLRKAEQQSRLACQIGNGSPLQHWWQMSRSLTHIRQGEIEKAIQAAESSVISAPNFRAPLRHLYPLYLKLGDTETAALKLHQIRRIEPDFSLAMIRNNESYPARTIRETSLIELADLVD